MVNGKRSLTTGDVAKICNVASRTVAKWFDSGHLKGYRIPGSKDRRVPVGELVSFMKEYNIPPADFYAGTVRLLIADSDSQEAKALAKNLKKKKDYEIQVAESNFEIGTAVHKFIPHVILINLQAGRIDTKNICKDISENEELQTIKIIAIANNAGKTKVKNLLAKGFDNVITDCNDIAEVIKKIEEAIAIVY